MVSGDRARASSIRSVLIRLPMRSSIHIRAPPAPQQKPRSLQRCISVGLHARDGLEDLAGRGEDAVVAAQEAGVVVGELLLDPLGGGELALLDQAGQQLGVVDDLVGAAELGVLVGDGVEAVRAAGHDRLRRGLVQGLDVLLGQHGVHELVADPAGRVAGAGLGRAEHRELDPGGVQQGGDGLGGLAGPVLQGAGAADPEQVLHVGRRSCRRRRGPRSRARSSSRRGGPGPSPTGRPCSPGSSACRPPRPGTRTRSAPGSGACRRCGRCARCRPGTPPRTPRSSCTTRSRRGR